MTKLLALTLFLFTIILISCNRDEKEHKNHNLTEHYFDNASAFQNRYEYDSDIFYYKKELNRSISDTVRIKSLIRLCSIFWWIEMPDSARQYFHESEKVYNKIIHICYPHSFWIKEHICKKKKNTSGRNWQGTVHFKFICRLYLKMTHRYRGFTTI